MNPHNAPSLMRLVLIQLTGNILYWIVLKDGKGVLYISLVCLTVKSGHGNYVHFGNQSNKLE